MKRLSDKKLRDSYVKRLRNAGVPLPKPMPWDTDYTYANRCLELLEDEKLLDGEKEE